MNRALFGKHPFPTPPSSGLGVSAAEPCGKRLGSCPDAPARLCWLRSDPKAWKACFPPAQAERGGTPASGLSLAGAPAGVPPTGHATLGIPLPKAPTQGLG